MKKAYPIILLQRETFILVYVPDFEINTQGETIVEAIEMARDAIGVVGIDIEDDGESLPEPTIISEVKTNMETDIVTLVDVDFSEYRRKNDLRVVKKNCTIPSWLSVEAERAGINFSAILTAALKKELKI
ncbi:MAG: type II toxin-antitoxin system HicB family antitoxin [Lachnospiraceae bacterium]|nr:type II toxin-antitoxin system HicB family antitoxin [Lachnospiraceae bacterium]